MKKFYFTNEIISGKININIQEEKLEAKKIFLTFIGEIGYTTLEKRYHRDNNGQSHTEHYTEYHRIPFMNVRLPVVRPQDGQVKS